MASHQPHECWIICDVWDFDRSHSATQNIVDVDYGEVLTISIDHHPCKLPQLAIYLKMWLVYQSGRACG